MMKWIVFSVEEIVEETFIDIYFNYERTNKSLCRMAWGFCAWRRKNYMSRNDTRVKKAMDIALERLDYIMDYYTAPDFVEVTGK